jgi:hypothetical protein
VVHPQFSDREKSLQTWRAAAKAVEDSRQWVVLQLVDWAREYNIKKYTRYEMLNRTSNLDSLKRNKQWKDTGCDD